jgi:hypothetical protein
LSVSKPPPIVYPTNTLKMADLATLLNPICLVIEVIYTTVVAAALLWI